jgi:hypothetical protein
LGNKLTNTGALPSACCVRWDQPNGWDRRCWRVVDVFELCLRDGRVNVRFGGKRSSRLRLRLKQLVPRLRRRSLPPTGCETIVPLSRIIGWRVKHLLMRRKELFNEAIAELIANGDLWELHDALVSQRPLCSRGRVGKERSIGGYGASGRLANQELVCRSLGLGGMSRIPAS